MHKVKIYKIFKVKFFVLVVLFAQIFTLSTSKIGAQASEFIPKLTTDKKISFTNLNTNIKNLPQPLTPKEIEAIQYKEALIQAQKDHDSRLENRGSAINSFLSYKGSPLSGYGKKIAQLEEQYGVPANLVIGISGAESSFCQINFKPFNCWGWMTVQRFSSYDESLDNYFSYLANYYFAHGRTNPSSIGPIYCVPPHPWVEHVYGFMSQMNF